MMDRVHDLIGIGIGPFNLGLACLAQPIRALDCLFLEKAPEFNWHGGTLMEAATLQTPFLCDLVTMADPKSPFSLLNHMKETGQIYAFYALLIDTENFFLPRNTFNAYFRWAAGRLDTLRFGQEVIRVEHDEARGLYRVTARLAETGQERVYLARRLVLGTGMRPKIPEACAGVADKVVHTADYLANRARLRQARSITVIGSGQSAAEVFHDLLGDIDRHGYSLTWVTRSPRLVPRELTKQTLQMTTPDYTDYFFSLPRPAREALVESLKAVYQGVNPSLINDIVDLRYRKMLGGHRQIELIANTELEDCRHDPAGGGFRMDFLQWESGQVFSRSSEALVLGTGYEWPERSYLDPVRERINWCGANRFAVARNLSIDRSVREIFTSNAEIHADSFIPPDLGQACHRNSIILKEILGQEVYPIERNVAFQQFRPADAETDRMAVPLSA